MYTGGAMSINWQAVNRVLSPIKGYEDACRRCRESFSYPVVRDAFNLSISELETYTRLGVGADPRKRYDKYAEILIDTLDQVQQAGVDHLLDLIHMVGTRAAFESFVTQNGIEAEDIAEVLKYCIYWVIPGNKYLSGLARPDPASGRALEALREIGIRTNLDLLQRGNSAKGRKALARETGLSAEVILEWVNRADLSRMPWASKATISNIMGAGYGSLAKLASANPEKLCEDFFRYGKSIGKNLKMGNEIENSQRFAKILPMIMEEKG